MRHDELRDLLAAEMRHVVKDVATEPELAPLTGETLARGANVQDDARADIRARGFWNRLQNAFFDIRVFYPHASSYLQRPLPNLYSSFETEKKREYNERVLQVDRGTFSPLVFSSSGGAGHEAECVLKRLALLLSEKRHEPYSVAMRLLRCRVSFALIRAAHVCLRGTRTRQCRVVLDNVTPAANLAVSEAAIL